jgi:ABC-type polar amino acid transport system ATPase subunit
MVRIRGLRKRYRSLIAIDGIDAGVRERECVAIVGPSGCGKSTLLRCMNALESFDEGAVEIAGLTLAPGEPKDRKRLRDLRAAVGMVFQDLHLFPHLTALENVALAPSVVAGRRRSEARERGRELLARVGLADRAGAYPHELSGGQRQRVAIARALAMPLRVLLLDEPTSAIDPEMREDVREVLRSLAHESALTMVLVTHEMRLASELADRVWEMQAGRIVANGTPSEVLNRAGLLGDYREGRREGG